MVTRPTINLKNPLELIIIYSWLSYSIKSAGLLMTYLGKNVFLASEKGLMFELFSMITKINEHIELLLTYCQIFLPK